MTSGTNRADAMHKPRESIPPVARGRLSGTRSTQGTRACVASFNRARLPAWLNLGESCGHAPVAGSKPAFGAAEWRVRA